MLVLFDFLESFGLSLIWTMFSIVNFYFIDLIGDLLAPSSLVSPNMLIAIEFTAVL